MSKFIHSNYLISMCLNTNIFMTFNIDIDIDIKIKNRNCINCNLVL